MAPKHSAGFLMYRRGTSGVEVLLAHPGGPFFAKKDEGAWSIPKGEIEEGEVPLVTAVREYEEETGVRPDGDVVELGQVQQSGGKIVHAWAFEGDYDTSQPPPSNTFSLEWPPRSGKQQEFPEIDKLEFFDLQTASRKINPAQVAFLERLSRWLADSP